MNQHTDDTSSYTTSVDNKVPITNDRTHVNHIASNYHRIDIADGHRYIKYTSKYSNISNESTTHKITSSSKSNYDYESSFQ